MNDRFKFRVWDEVIKQYRKEGTIQLSGNGQPFIINGNMQPEDIDNVIIEQCTGLTDKNGRFIYEGDVISFSWQLKDNEVCKIVWDKIHCSFACVDIKTGADFITWYSVFENGQSNRCEIIGNIHENGERK